MSLHRAQIYSRAEIAGTQRKAGGEVLPAIDGGSGGERRRLVTLASLCLFAKCRFTLWPLRRSSSRSSADSGRTGNSALPPFPPFMAPASRVCGRHGFQGRPAFDPAQRCWGLPGPVASLQNGPPPMWHGHPAHDPATAKMAVLEYGRSATASARRGLCGMGILPMRWPCHRPPAQKRRGIPWIPSNTEAA